MRATWLEAVLRGDAEAVRAELAAGADVDARDRHGQTGLMVAAQRGHAEVVAVLIAAAADLDVTAKFQLSALMLAVVAGHADCARLLARAGADRSLRGSGAPGFHAQTAYDLAVARGMRELSDELAEGRS